MTNKIFNHHVSLFLLVMPLILGIQLAHGDISAYGDFGISLDNTCLVKHKNNVSGVCPTYQEINALFPDTSVQGVSGEFEYRDGLWQRSPSNFHSSYNYYTQQVRNGSTLFIDPPSDTQDRIKQIVIRANLNEYKIPGATGGYDAVEHSMTMGHGRYVSDCRIAYINAAEWIFLVGDTIHYMNNGCGDSFTDYNSTKTTFLNRVEHDISTSYKWQLEEWIKNVIRDCGFTLCIGK